jgi:hypothetical protein
VDRGRAHRRLVHPQYHHRRGGQIMTACEWCWSKAQERMMQLGALHVACDSKGGQIMSILAILTAMNLFFGSEAPKVEYSLFPDNPAWYVLDDSGIEWTVTVLDPDEAA